ncbi:MAG: AAA family ATPase [Planctomycetes bacterium]|nr:AAA family ATPase [Planctomycetota bacterium]
MRHHFLRAIELENFMLHRSTRLALSAAPVVLLTGANGSGKTQILDALILAMGHHPKRVKKGNLAELVGAFGSRARVSIEIANPVAEGARAIRVDEPDLAQAIDHDLVAVSARIDRESGLSYSIRARGKEKRVRRQDVRAIFDAVGISADNRLAFTEEGTVNVFADQTGRAKLDLVLETTGLAAYRQNLVEAIERADKAYAQLEPMRSKLKLEKDYLASLEKNLELARRREEMERQLSELAIEEPWARAAEVEEREAGQRERIAGREEELATAEREETEIHRRAKETAGEEADLSERIDGEEELLAQVRGRIERLAGEISSRKDFLSRLGARAEALDEADGGALQASERNGERAPLAPAFLAAEILIRRAPDAGIEILGEPRFRPAAPGEEPVFVSVLVTGSREAGARPLSPEWPDGFAPIEALLAPEAASRLAAQAGESARRADIAALFRLLQAERAKVEADLEARSREKAEEERGASRIREVLAGLADDLSEIERARRAIDESARDLEGRRNALAAVIAKYREELDETRSELAALRREAEEAGPRPKKVRDRRAVHDERVRLEGQLAEIRATRVSMDRYREQKAKVERMEEELAGSSEHLERLRADMKEKYDAWHREVQARIDRMAEGVTSLLSGVYEGLRLRVENLLDPERAAFHMEIRRRGKTWRDLVHLSGGEKVLAVEALILSMHLLTDSPVHAIDEFTQRLDLEFKAYALDMVARTVERADRALAGPYSPQFLLLAPDTIGVEWDETSRAFFQRVVLAATRAGGGGPREATLSEVGDG